MVRGASPATYLESILVLNTSSYAIETRDLCKAYGTKVVVNHLNLKVPTGSVYGFLGRNGAGKSTTTKMLMGMLPADAGSGTILGDDIPKIQPATRGKIAYIAEGHPLYAWMTIKQLNRFTKSFYQTWDQTLFDRIIDHFQLETNRPVKRFSKGQQAQISLALALAPDPELLVLDDPTLGLDTVVRRDFIESMIQIIQRQGRTILFSSHILGDVERVTDRIGIMVDGVLRADCPTDVFKQSLVKFVLEFDSPPPLDLKFPDSPGLVHSRVFFHQLHAVVVNPNGVHQKLAESLNPKEIIREQMNLEDAFLEYTREKREALSFFTS